ncbi:hypothetical protein KC19_9G003800 [Ceratodon purpureus]|uniref:Uncharacterized protein n=1 Tax=Ceratodon purpureus TaxID=3225 RepID=A0A8T0GM95_CERPU|nr:hypothetical protein KC19_9G003800 [Ceratodon purpureus]
MKHASQQSKQTKPTNKPTYPSTVVVVRDCVVQSTPESTPLSGSSRCRSLSSPCPALPCPHIHTHSQWRSLVIPSTLSHATHHHPSAPPLSLSLSPFASLLPALSVSGTPSVLSLSLSLSRSRFAACLPACLPWVGSLGRATPTLVSGRISLHTCRSHPVQVQPIGPATLVGQVQQGSHA